MHSCISFIFIMYIYVFISKPEPHSFIRTTHFRKWSIHLKLCDRYMKYSIQISRVESLQQREQNIIQTPAGNKNYNREKCRERERTYSERMGRNTAQKNWAAELLPRSGRAEHTQWKCPWTPLSAHRRAGQCLSTAEHSASSDSCRKHQNSLTSEGMGVRGEHFLVKKTQNN